MTYRPLPAQFLEICKRDWLNILPVRPGTYELEEEYSDLSAIEVAINELIAHAQSLGLDVYIEDTKPPVEISGVIVREPCLEKNPQR